jgi:hypothetical protein
MQEAGRRCEHRAGREPHARSTAWWGMAWGVGAALAAFTAMWWLMPRAPSLPKTAGAVPGPASPVPAILMAMVVSALAGLGGVVFGSKLNGRDGLPTGQLIPPTAIPGPELEPEQEREQRRLHAYAAQRSVLARRLAELLPQLPEALAWQASNALDEAGIQPFSPDGDVFDPAFHHAVGTEPSTAPDMVNTIARTIRPGYRDDHETLVYPKVVVYADEHEPGIR